MRAMAAVISPVQGQRSASRSLSRRLLRASRPATAKRGQAEPFRFPAAGLAGQGEHLGPGDELAGQWRALESAVGHDSDQASCRRSC